jgi:hypothetical protein
MKKPEERLIEEETARVLSVIRIMLRILDITNRDVEKNLHLSYGYLSRLFAGTIDLKASHLLAIAQCIGLQPAELFRLLYPQLPARETQTAKKLRETLSGLQAASVQARTDDSGGAPE